MPQVPVFDSRPNESNRPPWWDDATMGPWILPPPQETWIPSEPVPVAPEVAAPYVQPPPSPERLLIEQLNAAYPSIPGTMYAGGSRWFDEGTGQIQVPPGFKAPAPVFDPGSMRMPTPPRGSQVGNTMNANGQAAYKTGLLNQASQQTRMAGVNPYAKSTPPLAPNPAAPASSFTRGAWSMKQPTRFPGR